MRYRSVTEKDILFILEESISKLPHHPWIQTESDIKCALYTAFYNMISVRIANLESCGWRVITEYPLPDGKYVDFAVLHNGHPCLFVEIKYIKNFTTKEIADIREDYLKRKSFLISEEVKLLQLVASEFDGDYEEVICEKMIRAYGELYEGGLGGKAYIIYIRIPSG